MDIFNNKSVLKNSNKINEISDKRSYFTNRKKYLNTNTGNVEKIKNLLTYCKQNLGHIADNKTWRNKYSNDDSNKNTPDTTSNFITSNNKDDIYQSTTN